jgi:hypothetical protein
LDPPNHLKYLAAHHSNSWPAYKNSEALNCLWGDHVWFILAYNYDDLSCSKKVLGCKRTRMILCILNTRYFYLSLRLTLVLLRILSLKSDGRTYINKRLKRMRFFDLNLKVLGLVFQVLLLHSSTFWIQLTLKLPLHLLCFLLLRHHFLHLKLLLFDKVL